MVHVYVLAAWLLYFFYSALVSEAPLTLKLHFEPAGRPGEDREYYLQNKENICVVCGTEENCVRKNIVPHEYRRQEVKVYYLSLIHI